MIKIEDELKNDFLDYAIEVNNNRSFPDARDGLKPVQRAILWSMWQNKFVSAKPHVKCAKISGDVISRLHPHGDVAVYEALVRLSQDWVYHKEIIPIDFHGANGSVIAGNTPASARYTECRLSKFSETNFFNAIDKNIVNMIDNFSEDEKWPEVLPSTVPILLLSQVSGIGYTIANDWLPHNLVEVFEKVKEYMKKGKISYDNIYPDFPTGGIIINKKELPEIYKTGKGKVILRGKTRINNNYIEITELPYQVYAEPFIQKVKDLVNAGSLNNIEDICNKSDDNGLLIEIECSENPDAVLNKLYKLTDLQITLSANQMALINGIPELLNLDKYLQVYIDHNITCLQREYTFDLNKAQARLEIVNGLLKALSLIDKIISIIKQSDSSDAARVNLISKFNFTENQARAIIDMKLGKLANLESKALQDEQDTLNNIIAKCNTFLADPKLQQKEFLKRLGEFVKNYGWDRKTEVLDIDLDLEKAQVIKADKVIKDYIVILENNNIKRVELTQYKKSRSSKEISIQIAENRRVILVSNLGMLYKVDTKDITKCSQNSIGVSLNSLLNLKENEIILNIFTGDEEYPYLFFITKNGLAKKMEAIEAFGISKKIGTPIMKLDSDDLIIDCRVLAAEKIKVLYNGKEKIIDTDKINLKKRLSGGVCAVKCKNGSFIELK